MMNIYLTNLGKYNEGELIGEWVELPVSQEELQKVFPVEINEDDEELVDHCPECHIPMDIIKTLEPYEVVMSYEEFCNHDPPENMKKLTVIGPALF